MVLSLTTFFLSSRGYLANMRARLNPVLRGAASIPMFQAIIGLLGVAGLISSSSSLESSVLEAVSDVELSSDRLVYSLLSVSLSETSSFTLVRTGEGGLRGMPTEFASLVFIASSSSSISSMVGEWVPGEDEGLDDGEVLPICLMNVGLAGEEAIALFRAAMNSFGDLGETSCLAMLAALVAVLVCCA